MRGGDTAAVAQATAPVLRFRVMWLKEKANAESKPSGSTEQEGLDTTIETGLFPEGIAGVTDIKKAQLARIEALKDCLQILNGKQCT